MEGYLAMDRPQLPRVLSSQTAATTTTTDNSNRITTTGLNTYIPPDTALSTKRAQSVSAPWQDQEQQPPYTNDYLTPTSPEQSQAHAAPRPQVPAFPPGGFSRQASGVSQSSVRSRDGEIGHVARADSGIEADFRARGPLSSTSTANPRSSTIYECIDSNQYTEPSPHFFCGPSSGGETTSSGASTAPTTACLLLTAASDCEDGLDDNVRRRLHPAYSALNHSTPQVYTETCRCAKALGDRGRGSGVFCASSAMQLRCLWCGLVILILLSLFLLVVVAYMFFFIIPGMQAHIHVQQDDLKKMQLDHRNLSEKVDALFRYPAANETLSTSAAIQMAVAEAVAVRMAELNNSVLQFGTRLDSLSTNLQFQIDNMSHVPDLKAVSAVGNLGSCSSERFSSMQALPGPSSTTSWLPGEDMLLDKVVMSATCAVKGGDLHFVETRKSPSTGHVQYRCRCDGRRPSNADRRTCYIHLVLCPRELPVDLAVGEPPASN